MRKHSPTPEELAAVKVGYAALRGSSSPTSYIVEQVVYALGSAQMLQSPETAAEHADLTAKYVDAASTVADLVRKRGSDLRAHNADRDELETLRARVAELEAERHSTNDLLAEVTEACRATETERNQLKARLAELEAATVRPVDEEPVPFVPTPKAVVSAARLSALIGPAEMGGAL